MVLWVGLQCGIVAFPSHTHFLVKSENKTVSWVGLQCGIVAFPSHTHFLGKSENKTVSCDHQSIREQISQ